MQENLIVTPENAKAFEKSMDMLDKSISELRRVAFNMIPEVILKLGLDTAVKDFCESAAQHGAIQFSYLSTGLEENPLPPNVAGAVYLIVEELVENVLKHASANTAAVRLIRKNDLLDISVEDDGKGFDIRILQPGEGMGYLNIRNSLNFMNGIIDIQTSPGNGTSVKIEISTIST
jgi:signal transduction histidine kinase